MSSRERIQVEWHGSLSMEAKVRGGNSSRDRAARRRAYSDRWRRARRAGVFRGAAVAEEDPRLAMLQVESQDHGRFVGPPNEPPVWVFG